MHKHYRKLLLGGLLMILANLFTPAMASAQGPVDPAEMAAFFDEAFSVMEVSHIPGAVVVIVKGDAPSGDGDILFSKGYGYADVEKGIPVDPASTLFRIGSLSKLFTWTAVMQLAEQGQVNLDADINTYLDFQIPATYPEPITLKHLMSHTPGFEERAFGSWAASPETLMPLGDWLKTHIPARVRPPGLCAAYSNYGTTLAGYIVERVSGMAYADYVAHNILQPLAMTHSSAQQPLPSELRANIIDHSTMALGYQFVDGHYVPQDFETINIVPAGAISATPHDIAHFMAAHLQDGQYAGHRILETATAQQMHTRLFSHDARIPGLAYGFFEKEQGGQRILWHGGDTLFFHSQLALLPEAGIGFFAACNGASCAGFPQKVFAAFMAHYYPTATPAPTPATGFEPHARLVAGRYRSTRMSHTTAQRVMSLLSSGQISAVDDATLAFGGSHFVEVAPFVFQEVDGDHMLAFHQDADGTVTHAAVGGSPSALEQVPVIDSPALHFTLLGLSVVLFLSAFIGVPLVSFTRLGESGSTPVALASVARWGLMGASSLCLLFLLLAVLGAVSGEQSVIMGRVPFGKSTWVILFALILIVALADLAFTFIAWYHSYWGLFGRIHYAAVTFAVWAFVCFVNYWHLLTW